MSRIKGRYVAQVAISFDREWEPGMRTADEIRNYMVSGGLDNGMKQFLKQAADVDEVEVIRMYADVIEIKGDE